MLTSPSPHMDDWLEVRILLGSANRNDILLNHYRPKWLGGLSEKPPVRGVLLSQVPAECRECGFVFRKRDRLKAPSRCPVCKGKAISDPSFRVEEG